MRDSDLRFLSADGADFSGADLTRAKFGKDNVGGITDLKDVVLRGTKLHDVDLRETTIDWSEGRLSGATYTTQTRFPDHVNPAALGMRLVEG